MSKCSRFTIVLLISSRILWAEQYQDIIVNNQIISPGVRESATRYAAIKEHLKMYKRPFTILDIGAAQGYFSFRTAHDFPSSSAVMIEGEYLNVSFNASNKLEELCALNTDLKNIIYLKKHMNPSDFRRLAECEHFDVVLCLNVIHHFGKEWQTVAQAVFKMGDYVIIETPPSTDKVFMNNSEIKAIEDFLKAKKGKVIAETPRHTDPNAMALMQIFETPKKELPVKHWFYGNTANAESVSYEIDSTFEKKNLLKKHNGKVRKTEWLPGINLVTFKALSGVWPNTPQLISSLVEFANIKHRDLLPWNILVQGNDLAAFDDDGEVFADPVCSLLQTIRFAALNTYSSVENFILHHLYPREWLNNYKACAKGSQPLMTEISLGELVDKITILEIKSAKTADASKLKNINYELTILRKTLTDQISNSDQLDHLKAELFKVNQLLWDVEDKLREKERLLSFDEEFITLARSVYIINDRRAELKRAINLAFGSQIIEEKIYQSYNAPASITSAI
ncbi:MAG TPA: DUF6165 family protein [Candidatus Babeliales bacterium]|nr:DUF6165 family protein [Candidatus Babeliales bacterium]